MFTTCWPRGATPLPSGAVLFAAGSELCISDAGAALTSMGVVAFDPCFDHDCIDAADDRDCETSCGAASAVVAGLPPNA